MSVALHLLFLCLQKLTVGPSFDSQPSSYKSVIHLFVLPYETLIIFKSEVEWYQAKVAACQLSLTGPARLGHAEMHMVGLRGPRENTPFQSRSQSSNAAHRRTLGISERLKVMTKWAEPRRCDGVGLNTPLVPLESSTGIQVKN